MSKAASGQVYIYKPVAPQKEDGKDQDVDRSVAEADISLCNGSKSDKKLPKASQGY